MVADGRPLRDLIESADSAPRRVQLVEPQAFARVPQTKSRGSQTDGNGGDQEPARMNGSTRRHAAYYNQSALSGHAAAHGVCLLLRPLPRRRPIPGGSIRCAGFPKAQLFAITHEQRQVAQAVDPPRNAVRKLIDGLHG